MLRATSAAPVSSVITARPEGYNRQDTVSLALVVALTALALLLGLLVKGSAQGRTREYRDQAGVVLHYPDTWQLDNQSAAAGTARVIDLRSGGFPTIFEMHKLAVDPAASDAQALAAAQGNLSATRGGELSAFKVLSVTAGQTIKGLPGATDSFAYVSTATGLVHSGPPLVVLGDDYLVRKAGTVYMFSLHAAETRHSDALLMFQRFLDTAQLP